jgi:hypothetical protein
MPYEKPSTSAIERLPLHPPETPTIVSVSCGDAMKRFRTIAKHGMRSQQFVFICPSCKGIDTREVTRAA